MKLRSLTAGCLTVALVVGCATPGGTGPKAPIEERGPSATRAKRPAPVVPPKPQTPPYTARAPQTRSTSPSITAPRRSSVPPARTEGPKNEYDMAPVPALPGQSGDAMQNGSSSPPVVALVDLAQQQIERGQTEAGAATLERALAIEPQNPHLWHRLARLRLQQGALAQAAELAAKSNLYAATTPALQVRNWRLIAEVRERQGNGQGAQEAYRRAELAEELAR